MPLKTSNNNMSNVFPAKASQPSKLPTSMYLSIDASEGRSVIRNLKPLNSISEGSGLRGVTAAGIVPMEQPGIEILFVISCLYNHLQKHKMQ